ASSKDCNDRFFPLVGNHGELHFAFLNVENRIRRLAMRKDNLIYFIGGSRPSTVCLGEEGLGVERGFLLAFHCSTFRAESSRGNAVTCSIIRSSRTSSLTWMLPKPRRPRIVRHDRSRPWIVFGVGLDLGRSVAVKVFGCRPMTRGPHTLRAGVGKPPREE